MILSFIEQKEKKVEYLELIYDLIFVYIIGRNNALLHHISDGFVEPGMFFAYLVCTFAVIQIWNFTTYYVNLYGRHSIRDHVFLLINMFLLYFVAKGTQENWQEFHVQYHVAWALILLNIGVQYLIELRHYKNDPMQKRRILRIACVLLVEALLVLAANVEFHYTKTSYVSAAAILFGIASTSFSGKKSLAEQVDFAHLSERAMLYVVFTFGEMIIAIASYFEDALTANNLYFSAMAFLIVVGLFLSYGVVYDHIVDREKKTDGLGYMFSHVFLIFALSNITNGLEFMRNPAVDVMPKVLFLTGSFLLYYGFLFSVVRYAKVSCKPRPVFYLLLGSLGGAFCALMILLHDHMQLNIAVTVLFVFSVFLILFRHGKKMTAAAACCESSGT